MNNPITSHSVCIFVLIVLLLSACGPSQAELDAAASRTAAALSNTQTAQAPTATSRPTATSTATLRPTNTQTPTLTPVPPTPKFTLAPTSKVINWTKSQILTGHTDWINGLAFSPDGQTLASGSFDGSIILWDANSGEQQNTLNGHWDGVRSVAYSPDGHLLASGSEDKTIILWDPSSGAKRQTLTGHMDAVKAVVFSPDGRTLASGSFDTTIILWDANSGEQMKVLDGHTGGVTSLSFSPDGQLLASAGQDGNIVLWDTQKGTQLRTLTEHTAIVNSVAFSPDGQTLASGSNDKTIILWDPSSGEIERTLTGHSKWGVEIVYYPDGRTLASGAYDDPVIVWDVETGEQQQSLIVPDRLNSLAFSPDGMMLAGGLYNGQILLWEAPATTPAVATRTPSKLQLAKNWPLLISDSFYDNTHNWMIGDKSGDYADITWTIGDGVYRWEALARKGFVWWVYPEMEDVRDFYLAADFQLISGPADAEHGLTFRHRIDNSYYLFEINAAQQYAVYYYFHNEWETLVEWTDSDVITLRGLNRLAVVTQDSQILCYINDQLVAEVFDKRRPGGKTGFAISMNNAGDYGIWELSNYELRTPTPETEDTATKPEPLTSKIELGAPINSESFDATTTLNLDVDKGKLDKITQNTLDMKPVSTCPKIWVETLSGANKPTYLVFISIGLPHDDGFLVAIYTTTPGSEPFGNVSIGTIPPGSDGNIVVTVRYQPPAGQPTPGEFEIRVVFSGCEIYTVVVPWP